MGDATVGLIGRELAQPATGATIDRLSPEMCRRDEFLHGPDQPHQRHPARYSPRPPSEIAPRATAWPARCRYATRAAAPAFSSTASLPDPAARQPEAPYQLW